MQYGQIIKKAWKIAWRYRFLWVLGLFAGVTGVNGGGGFSNGGRSYGSNGSGSSGGSPFSMAQWNQAVAVAQRWMPAIIAGLVIWLVLAIVLWALSLAAKGGLVWAVNEIEEGRPPTLGEAWRRGFSHAWQVLGLGLMLQLPVLLVVLLLGAAIAVPIALAFARGTGASAAAAIFPACGALVIGVPLLIVMGFILGIMYVIALRRIVLDGEGVVQSAKDAWRTFRARFKDTALMWLINWGLNVVAALAIGIPIVVLTLVMAVPSVFAGIGQNWGALGALAGAWLLIVIVVSLFYQAVWGTFTSALWTILYRRMTGREPVVPTPPRGTVPSYSMPTPTPPGAPPAGYVAPPVAGWAPAAGGTPGWSPDPNVAGPPRGPAHDPYSPLAGEHRSPLDPYTDSPGRPPLDPYTPWVPGEQPPVQPSPQPPAPQPPVEQPPNE